MRTKILMASVVSATAAAAATLLGTAAAPEMGKLAGLGRGRKASEEGEAQRAQRPVNDVSDHPDHPVVMWRKAEHGTEPLCGCEVHDWETGPHPVLDEDMTEAWSVASPPDIEPLIELQAPHRERWLTAGRRMMPWVGATALVCGTTLSCFAITAQSVTAAPAPPAKHAPATETITAAPVAELAKTDPVTVTVTPPAVTVTETQAVPVAVPVDPFDFDN